ENFVTQNTHPSIIGTYFLKRIDSAEEVVVRIGRKGFREAENIQYAAPAELGHMQISTENNVDSFVLEFLLDCLVHLSCTEFANEKRQQRKPVRTKIRNSPHRRNRFA